MDVIRTILWLLQISVGLLHHFDRLLFSHVLQLCFCSGPVSTGSSRWRSQRSEIFSDDNLTIALYNSEVFEPLVRSRRILRAHQFCISCPIVLVIDKRRLDQMGPLQAKHELIFVAFVDGLFGGFPLLFIELAILIHIESLC